MDFLEHSKLIKRLNGLLLVYLTMCIFGEGKRLEYFKKRAERVPSYKSMNTSIHGTYMFELRFFSTMRF